jgi:hypothetical protein
MNNFMFTLIEDILEYLVHNPTIRGFTRERLEELMKNKFSDITGYEFRFLVNWSGIYLYQFEELYQISVSEIVELKDIILTNKKMKL